MNAAELAEQAINEGKLEDTKPVADADKKDTPKDAPKKDEPKEDKKADDKPEDKAKGDDKADDDKKEAAKEDEAEFTADDAKEVDAPEDKPSAPPTDTAGVQLSPAEQKYIVDNIGNPLSITGMQGDKEVTLKVFTPGDIPRDFKFGSDAEMIAAQNGFASLERRAESLLGNFRQQQSTEQASDFEKRENESIRADVADLQKAGDFPKFKVQPGSPGFDADPAAEQMTEVLKVMNERNEQYLAEYNQGRQYRHIGFKEAFEIWERNTSKAKASDDKKDAQDAEDKARKDVGEHIGTNRGLVTDKIAPARVRSGTTVSDILNRLDADPDW